MIVGKKLPGCGHVFHAYCLKGWLMQQRTCPTCRSDISAAVDRCRPATTPPPAANAAPANGDAATRGPSAPSSGTARVFPAATPAPTVAPATAATAFPCLYRVTNANAPTHVWRRRDLARPECDIVRAAQTIRRARRLSRRVHLLVRRRDRTDFGHAGPVDVSVLSKFRAKIVRGAADAVGGGDREPAPRSGRGGGGGYRDGGVARHSAPMGELTQPGQGRQGGGQGPASGRSESLIVTTRPPISFVLPSLFRTAVVKK